MKIVLKRQENQDTSIDELQQKSIVIAATIRNVSKTIAKELETIKRALLSHRIVKIILIESDSNDDTVEVVQKLAIDNPNVIQLIAMGDLKGRFPNVVQRIQFCRNQYVKEIRKILQEEQIDYVIVIDLDGINMKLNQESFESSFQRKDWDVVLANQPFGYYDIYALRHRTWCPENCATTVLRRKQKIYSKIPKLFLKRPLRVVTTLFVDDLIEKQSIYKKMRRISRSAPWIEVESGFGGLGIYKSDIFKRFDYGHFYEGEEVICEHVVLNRQITGAGLRILINPKLVNTVFCYHNLNKLTVVRIFRKVQKIIIEIKNRIFQLSDGRHQTRFR